MLSTLLLITGLIFVSLSVYLLVSVLLANKMEEQDVLAWASGEEVETSKSSWIRFSRPLVHNFTIQHALRFKSEDYRKKVEKKILISGLEKELTPNEFIGLQILWGVFLPLLLLLFNFALQLELSWIFILAMGIGGALLPHYHCKQKAKERERSVIIDLPFFVDILSLSTEAGLDFVSAVQRIIDKMKTDSVLADELRIVLKDIKLGSSRKEAFQNMARRLDILEVTSFVSILIDADQTGVGISSVLKQQSSQMRSDRFMRAEKAGAKAATAILIPLIIFSFPAIFIVVLAPIALSLWGGS